MLLASVFMDLKLALVVGLHMKDKFSFSLLYVDDRRVPCMVYM